MYSMRVRAYLHLAVCAIMGIQLQNWIYYIKCNYSKVKTFEEDQLSS